MSVVWVAFVCGFFVGGMAGVMMMCLMQVNRGCDDVRPMRGPAGVPGQE